VSARELSRQERDLYRSRAQDQQKAGTSVWKYIGIGFLLIVLVSFLVFLNRNAQNQQLGDEI
jgi:CHASE3 domain sensor protein